jgi:lysozyme family protein/peptidoglycan hydrolase-like protein with peptidoglycan-binding domain
MALTPAQTRQGYLNLWAAMSILAGRRLALNTVVAKIVQGRERYEAVEKATGVPWWFIGIVHYREAFPPCNFAGYLGNGQPWNKKTTKEPSKRGPFASWEEGAIDALTLQGQRDGWNSDWSLPTALHRFEAYNGWGYFYHGVNSAYVWSWTSQQQPGKYVDEGKWSSTFIDPQPGCAAMLKGLIDTGHAVVAGAPQAGETAGGATQGAGNDNADPGGDGGDRVALHIGSRGPDVVALQSKLRSLGYPAGAIDGAYGQNTADAVAAFQRRYGLKGDPGLWYTSYDFVLADAGSIVPAPRTGATPRSLEEQGDLLTRVFRFMRNVFVWVAGLFGVTIGGGETVTSTLTQTHDAADQVHSVIAWAHGNAWIILLVVCVAFAAVIEYARLHRAKEYASGAFQGPNQSVED